MDNDQDLNPTPAAVDVDVTAAAASDSEVSAAADAGAAAVDSELPEADGVPAAPADGDHVIEHRSFARADANAPMPVTVITTRDSLRATGA